MGRLTKVGGFGPLLFTLLLAPPAQAYNTKHILEWFAPSQTQAAGQDIYSQTDAPGYPTGIKFSNKCVQIDDVFLSINTTTTINAARVSFLLEDAALAGKANTPNYADWTVAPPIQSNSPGNISVWWNGKQQINPGDFTSDTQLGTSIDPKVWPESNPPDRIGIVVNLQLNTNAAASIFTRVLYEYVPCN